MILIYFWHNYSESFELDIVKKTLNAGGSSVVDTLTTGLNKGFVRGYI